MIINERWVARAAAEARTLFDELQIEPASEEEFLVLLGTRLQQLYQTPVIPDEHLTPREMDVLKLLVQGMTNREIGAKLFLSPNTVKQMNMSLFTKLQVRSRAEATHRAMKLGIV